MFFRNLREEKPKLEFEKKETMTSAASCSMAFDDGNNFFRDI
jgi:hypothetical protein